MLKFAVAAGAIYFFYNNKKTPHVNDLLFQMDTLMQNGMGVLKNDICPLQGNNLTMTEKILDLRCLPTTIGARGISAQNLATEMECAANCTNAQMNQLYANQLFQVFGTTADIDTAVTTYEALVQNGTLDGTPANACATVRTLVTPPINPAQLRDFNKNFMWSYSDCKDQVEKYLKPVDNICAYSD